MRWYVLLSVFVIVVWATRSDLAPMVTIGAAVVAITVWVGKK